MKNLLLISTFLLLSLNSFGQSAKVSGVIKNANNEVLERANVLVLLASDSSVSKFGFSNTQGVYEVKIIEHGDYFLRFSYLGYKDLDIPFSFKGGDLQINASLEPISENLAEVQIVEDMPIVISGDTISYKAEAFASGREKKLGEVLEQLPGFEVDDDGNVTVEGKTVEKVLVEGKEFFEGDTKIATKNIPANAIDRVQVLRNYNDVSPLSGLGTEDRIAINIKLKEGKKNFTFGDVSAKTGLDERYLGHANIFYYTPKATFNFIGDANNIGEPAFTFRDFFRFTGGQRSLSSRSGSGFQVGNDITSGFATDNDKANEIVSRFGAANFSFNPSKKITFSGFLIANNSTVDESSNVLRRYVGQDSDASIEQLTTNSLAEETAVLAKVGVKYTPSTKVQIDYDAIFKYSDRRSVEDQLSQFDIDTNSFITTNEQNPTELNQSLNFYLDHSDKSVFSLELQHQYKLQDPRFFLAGDRLPGISAIPNGIDSIYESTLQNRLIHTSQFDGAFKYYYIINDQNHLEFVLGTSIIDQGFNSFVRFNTSLGNVYVEDSNYINDVDFNLNDYYAGLYWKTKISKLTLRPGFNIHMYQQSDIQFDDVNSRDIYYVLPEILAIYDFKSSESLRFNYSVSTQFTDVNNSAEGILLRSYNQLFAGNRNLNNALYHNVSLNYNSFNLFDFTNIFTGLSYSYRLNDITNQVEYRGIDLVSSPFNAINPNQNLSAFGSYSKRYGYLKTGLRANYSFSEINNQINNQVNSNISFTQSYRVNFGTNFKKAPNVNINYNITYNDYLGNESSNGFVNHGPTVRIDALFLKYFTFKADYQYTYYRNNSTRNVSEYDFLNASLFYQKTDSHWEFSLQATNILNTEYLRQDSFTDNLISTSQTFVLPRYILLGVKYEI